MAGQSCFYIPALLFISALTTVLAQGNTTFTLTTQNNGLISSNFTLECSFRYSDDQSIVRTATFYRKTQKDPKFLKIAWTELKHEPVSYIDTSLQVRSTLQMVNKTFVQMEVSNLECSDKGEYKCEYVVAVRISEYYISGVTKHLTVTAPPGAIHISYSPNVIRDNEPVQFSCTGNVGLPPGFMAIYLLSLNGTEINLPAKQGNAQVDADGCTFRNTATGSFIFTKADDSQWKARCRVQQVAAIPSNFADTGLLTVKSRSEHSKGETTLTVTVPENDHLRLDCSFHFNDLVSLARRTTFYRKRESDQHFFKIAWVELNNNPVFFWNDTSLQPRSTFALINRTYVKMEVSNIQASDKAEYKCEYFIQDQFGDYYISDVFRYPDDTDMTSTTKYPVTFQRDTPTVRNITRTSAVLLVDLRDPPTQEVSVGYRLRCEETPLQRLAVNIDIEKKDASWGNGTARFTLTGLSPGRVYKCQASSRTDFGTGWTDDFSFMTVPKEVRKRPLSQFTWHHAVGLGSLGMLILLGVLVAQNRNG